MDIPKPKYRVNDQVIYSNSMGTFCELGIIKSAIYLKDQRQRWEYNVNDEIVWEDNIIEKI